MPFQPALPDKDLPAVDRNVLVRNGVLILCETSYAYRFRACTGNHDPSGGFETYQTEDDGRSALSIDLLGIYIAHACEHAEGLLEVGAVVE